MAKQYVEWNLLYNMKARYYKNTSWLFMNYGFAFLDEPVQRPELHGRDECNRYFNPIKTVGVNYSTEVIKFCNHTYKEEDIYFIHGDAESLPLTLEPLIKKGSDTT